LVPAKAGEYTASEVTTLAYIHSIHTWYRNVSIIIIIMCVKIPRGKSKVKSKTKSWSGHSSSLEKLLLLLL